MKRCISTWPRLQCLLLLGSLSLCFCMFLFCIQRLFRSSCSSLFGSKTSSSWEVVRSSFVPWCKGSGFWWVIEIGLWHQIFGMCTQTSLRWVGCWMVGHKILCWARFWSHKASCVVWLEANDGSLSCPNGCSPQWVDDLWFHCDWWRQPSPLQT